MALIDLEITQSSMMSLFTNIIKESWIFLWKKKKLFCGLTLSHTMMFMTDLWWCTERQNTLYILSSYIDTVYPLFLHGSYLYSLCTGHCLCVFWKQIDVTFFFGFKTPSKTYSWCHVLLYQRLPWQYACIRTYRNALGKRETSCRSRLKTHHTCFMMSLLRHLKISSV